MVEERKLSNLEIEIEERINKAKLFLGSSEINNDELALRIHDSFFLCKKLIEEYMEDLGLSFSTQCIDKFSYVYFIEDNCYLYLGLSFSIEKDFCNKDRVEGGTVRLIELTFNPFFSRQDIDLLFRKNYCYSWYYSDYLSQIEENIYNQECFKRFNEKYQDNKIQSINSEWDGKPAVAIIYEINYNDSNGYAVTLTDCVEKALRIGVRKYNDLFNDEKPYPYDQGGFELMFDGRFKSILVNLEAYSKSHKKSSERKEFIFEHIVFYIKPVFLKTLVRTKIASLKTDILEYALKNDLNHYEHYHFINGNRKWKSEYMLFELCKKIYGNQVVYQYRPRFLKTNHGQMSYDIYLSRYKIAIEYQGEQHFKPVDFFGGEEAFKKTRERDELKKNLSEINGIKLVYMTYNDTISSESIKQLVDSICKK